MKRDLSKFIPSKQVNYLKQLLGRSIVKVERIFVTCEYPYLDPDALDGPFFLKFDNSSTLFIDSVAEMDDSLVLFETIPDFYTFKATELVDTTNSRFWASRISLPIREINIVLVGEIESGLGFRLDTGKFYIYVWSDDIMADVNLSEIPEEYVITERKIVE